MKPRALTAFDTQIGHARLAWHERIREVLRREPDLDLEAVAERFGISRGSAHHLQAAGAGVRMTPREARLERRLCERERELIRAQTDLCWYRERWFTAAFSSAPGFATRIDDLIRCKRAAERRGRAA